MNVHSLVITLAGCAGVSSFVVSRIINAERGVELWYIMNVSALCVELHGYFFCRDSPTNMTAVEVTMGCPAGTREAVAW